MLPKTIEEVTNIMIGDNRSLVESARNAVIETEASLSIGVDLLKTIKERKAEIEKERKTWVKPLNEQVKRFNTKFKTLSEPLHDAEVGLKLKLLVCHNKIEHEKRIAAEEERQRREAELLAASKEKEELGNTEKAAELVEYAKKLKVKPEEVGRGGFTGAKSTVKKAWTYDLTDIAALAAERPDLVTVDAAEMRDAIRKGMRECAGIKVYQKETLSIR